MKVTLDTKINGVPIIVYIPESVEDLRKLLEDRTEEEQTDCPIHGMQEGDCPRC